MTTILLSIKNKYWKKIADGSKTFEIRKGKPRNIDLPFKVIVIADGKLVGSFICDLIVYSNNYAAFEKNSGLTADKIKEYTKGKEFYAWNISNLYIFDKSVDFSVLNIKRVPQTWQFLTNEQLCKLKEVV